MKIQFLNAKLETMSGWSRRCLVAGVKYHVSVRRGTSVRIAYKPRGQNRGWEWYGAVYSNGRCLWQDKVPGSIGARGLLISAGVFDEEEKP